MVSGLENMHFLVFQSAWESSVGLFERSLRVFAPLMSFPIYCSFPFCGVPTYRHGMRFTAIMLWYFLIQCGVLLVEVRNHEQQGVIPKKNRVLRLQTRGRKNGQYSDFSQCDRYCVYFVILLVDTTRQGLVVCVVPSKTETPCATGRDCLWLSCVGSLRNPLGGVRTATFFGVLEGNYHLNRCL
jgi:hypothetical protein